MTTAEAAIEAGPATISLDDVLPPEPVYDVPPPPKREVPTSRESAEAIEQAAAQKPRRGRPPKAARTTKDTTPPAKKGQPKAPLQPKDFRPDLTAVTDALWVVGSSLPPAAPYAAIVKANQAGLVEALNSAANQNHTVRSYVEKLTVGGGGTWAIQMGMVGLQMGMQCLQIARDKEFRDQLVAANAQALSNYMAQFATPEAQAAAAQAVA